MILANHFETAPVFLLSDDFYRNVDKRYKDAIIKAFALRIKDK